MRGTVHASLDEPAPAYHDFAQSANVFDLLGERYQTAASHLALAKLAAGAGASRAALTQPRTSPGRCSRSLGAEARRRPTCAAVRATRQRQRAAPDERVHRHDADDAIVRRLVDASILPDLLAREIVDRGQDCTVRSARSCFVAPAPAATRAWWRRPGSIARARALTAARAAGGGTLERDGASSW